MENDGAYLRPEIFDPQRYKDLNFLELKELIRLLALILEERYPQPTVKVSSKEKIVSGHFVDIVNRRSRIDNDKPTVLLAKWLVRQNDWPPRIVDYRGWLNHYQLYTPKLSGSMNSLWSLACQKFEKGRKIREESRRGAVGKSKTDL